MKRDLRQEAARIREDWDREKANLEAALHRVQDALSPSSSNFSKENIEKAAILEKSILRHLKEGERSICSLEKEHHVQYRSQVTEEGYTKLQKLFVYLELFSNGLISEEDLNQIHILDHLLQHSKESGGSSGFDTTANQPEYKQIFFLESILTDWQIAAEHIIQRELLAQRRIGSICFLSGENSLLGMKLSFMIRMCVINPDTQQAHICMKLANLWRAWNKSLRLDVKSAYLSPSKLLSTFGNRMDALFLDNAITSSWLQEYPSTYSEDLAALEHGFSFLIFLLKQDQVQFHQEILRKMHVETFPLFPKGSNFGVSGEDISTLLIARRQSRHILQYQQNSWDMMVRDFGWNAAPSLNEPCDHSQVLPSPYHLSEKILLVGNLGLRVVATSATSIWLNQREAACWRKLGGQLAALPSLFSENRSEKEWKIVLQLEAGDWTFLRGPQPPDDLLAQTYALIKVLGWLHHQSLFLNNIRLDTVAVSGPKISILSLERLDAQETEDTMSALLWFWYDLAYSQDRLPLRPWPIEYFPDKNLEEIPKILQPIAKVAATSVNLEEFLQKSSTFFE